MSKIIEKISEKKLFILKSEKVKKFLEEKNIEIEKLNCIEVFGGTGLNDSIFEKHAKSFEVWEIDRNLEVELKKNLPNANVKICDTIKTLKDRKEFQKFDLILIDNPIGVFGESLEYCEHFDLINNIHKFIEDSAIIIFLVNKKPFFFKKFIQKNRLWKKRRKEFYGDLDVENISIKFLLSFYTELFNNMGFDIDFSKNISRHSPHLDYLVYKISKKSNSEIINHTDWISLSELMKK